MALKSLATSKVKHAGLTQKQEQFLSLVEQGLALNSASFKVWKRTSYHFEKRWRKNEALMARVADAQAQLAEESKISRQDVLDGFMTAINHAQLQGDANGQIKGWTEIAKMHGYYEPETKIIEHNVKITQQDMTEMPLEELLKLSGGDPITLAASQWETITVDS